MTTTAGNGFKNMAKGSISTNSAKAAALINPASNAAKRANAASTAEAAKRKSQPESGSQETKDDELEALFASEDLRTSAAATKAAHATPPAHYTHDEDGLDHVAALTKAVLANGASSLKTSPHPQASDFVSPTSPRVMAPPTATPVRGKTSTPPAAAAATASPASSTVAKQVTKRKKPEETNAPAKAAPTPSTAARAKPGSATTDVSAVQDQAASAFHQFVSQLRDLADTSQHQKWAQLRMRHAREEIELLSTMFPNTGA